MIPLRDHLPTQRRPILTWLLIALNLVAFMVQRSAMSELGPRVVLQWGFTPAFFLADPASQWTTLLTSMFMHGGWLHLIGNLWFLWIFGDNVEDRLGRFKFVIFYLLSGVTAAFVQLATDPTSHIPMVGASGAISGVLAAYATLYPKSRVTVLLPFFIFFHLVELPALVVIAVWFFLQLLSGMLSLASPTSGGVAFFAHIGGFVAGLLLIRLLRPRPAPPEPPPTFPTSRPLQPGPPRRDAWNDWLPPDQRPGRYRSRMRVIPRPPPETW